MTKFAFGAGAVELLKLSSGYVGSDGEERLVCGVVLEPTSDPRVGPDSQNDIYDGPTVAAAEKWWRENSGAIGLQHREDISPSVEVIQSWISPVDAVIGSQIVYAGSWVLCVRVLDDDLWAAVKEKRVCGFSIGGVGQRVPLNRE